MKDLIIREMKENEHSYLEDFLYEAIFIPEGEKKPDKAIINNHDLQVYVKDFGKNKDDFCLVSEVNKTVVGACWIRIMNDYGHIDNDTPSLAISLLEEYRNKGIGTMLLKEMINRLKMKNYEKISLSVQKNNYAFKMYLKCGFEIIKETNEEYIMICELDK
jgi:ribosomal protein S18 acetylase RimI-like enzyme